PRARARHRCVRCVGLAVVVVTASRGTGGRGARRAPQLGVGEHVRAVGRRRASASPRVATRVTTSGASIWPRRMAISLGSVVGASIVSILVRPLTHAAASPLFVAAVTASAWLGGLSAGLLATVLATVALDAVMASSWPSFTLSEEAVAQLAVFVFVALFVSALDHARRRAESQREELLERERMAREDAESANRAKDEFVTMVAHELRTPLTAILSWSAAMSDARLGPALASPALEAIRRNATLPARAIAALVAPSRLCPRRLP